MKHSAQILLAAAIIGITVFFIFKRDKRELRQKTDDRAIIVGTNAEYPPYTFIENNEIVGFDIDIAKEVFKRLNKNIQIKDMAWTSLIPAIQLNQIQVIAAGMTATKKRAKHVLFTKPYLENDPLLILNMSSHSPINSVQELKNKKVVVDEGYTADKFISKQEEIEIIRTQSPIQGFQALRTHRADAYVIAKSSAESFIKKWGKENFNISEIPNTSESYSMAISKHHPKLLEEIQNALNEMKKDGTIEDLKNKWNLK